MWYFCSITYHIWIGWNIFFNNGDGMLDALSEMRITLVGMEKIPKNQAFALLGCLL